MIQLVQKAWPDLKPEAISTDFEKGLMNALGSAFPGAAIQDCLFHLVQNLKKKLMELQLMSQYKTDPDFSLAAWMISALAFVPPADLDNAVAELAAYLLEDLMPVLKYFENTYIGTLLHVLPSGRKNPMFPIRAWSVYC